MLVSNLVKSQAFLFDAGHKLVDCGEMGRGEIPVERVAVEIAAEPSLFVAGKGFGHAVGHRRFSCLLLFTCYPSAAPSATMQRRRNACRASRLRLFAAIAVGDGGRSP
jgi:hypothetical protein